VLKALGRIGTGETVGALLGAPLMLVPGLAISAWRLRRHRRRFDRSMVAKGFFAMRRELSQARSVQMALFARTKISPNGSGAKRPCPSVPTANMSQSALWISRIRPGID
jgi:hypothetical protein